LFQFWSRFRGAQEKRLLFEYPTAFATCSRGAGSWNPHAELALATLAMQMGTILSVIMWVFRTLHPLIGMG
jgi:hypothetical protein